ncbi:hypothetical protein AB5I41_30960 [Sphingomonas sp. MMS24-JH45]
MLAGKSKLADALKVGLGKRAEKKAEALAPMLYNMALRKPAPNIEDLLAKAGAFQQFVNQTTPKRIGHLFGAAMGSTAANGYTRQPTRAAEGGSCWSSPPPDRKQRAKLTAAITRAQNA